ncbi:MAG: hypothetical protein ACTSWL_07290 [Promethearchaeota archaeon]
MQVKLNPQLVKNGTLELSPSHPKVKTGEKFIALSDQINKQYSFVIKIVEIKENPGFKGIPILTLDKQLVGMLGKGDLVDLFPYNIPIAEEVTLGISAKNTLITPGNWTATIKDLLENKTLDCGEKIKVPINFKDNIMILRGFATKSKPEFPIQIGSTTQIFLKKYAEDKLTGLKDEFEQQKQDRTQNIREGIYQSLLRNINNSDLASVSETINFNINNSSPYLFDQSIMNLFTRFEIFKEKIHGSEKKTFNCSRTLIIHEQGIPKEVIEYQFNYSKMNGTILLKIYAENPVRAEENAQKYKKEILTIHEGLRGKLSEKEIHVAFRRYLLEKGKENTEIGKDQIPFAELMQSLSQDYPDWNVSSKKCLKWTKKMAKDGLISEIEKLPTGFNILHFQPLEITMDPTDVLRFGAEEGELTKEAIMLHFGWDEFRTTNALGFLEDRKLMKKTHSYKEGTKYFFKS